jgi:hypothetical protein
MVAAMAPAHCGNCAQEKIQLFSQSSKRPQKNGEFSGVASFLLPLDCAKSLPTPLLSTPQLP